MRLTAASEDLYRADGDGTLHNVREHLKNNAGDEEDGESVLTEKALSRALLRATDYLHWAVQIKPKYLNPKTRKAREKKVKKALRSQKGALVNLTDYYGWTALLLATEKGNVEAVAQLLKERHLDLNKKAPNGMTALALALLLKESQIVDMLKTDNRCDQYPE